LAWSSIGLVIYCPGNLLAKYYCLDIYILIQL
jgi:hypothetical protein